MATCEDFEHLRQEFDAVYLAIGARRQKRLPRLDYTRPWVMDGADYLARANWTNRPCRFDVVAIDDVETSPTITVYPNAFESTS